MNKKLIILKVDLDVARLKNSWLKVKTNIEKITIRCLFLTLSSLSKLLKMLKPVHNVRRSKPIVLSKIVEKHFKEF